MPAPFVIAHINDTHSHFDPGVIKLCVPIHGNKQEFYVRAGGYPRLAKFLECKRESTHKEQELLLLHAGDCFQGSLYFSFFKGRANAELNNRLKIDAMGLGNHELDLGNAPFAHFLKQIEFPILASNLCLEPEHNFEACHLQQLVHSDSVPEFVVRKVQGKTLAIFGLTLENMADISCPDPGIAFTSPVSKAKQMVTRARQFGVDAVVCLSHLGYDKDKELAAEIDGIDLIIGGHTHVLQGDFTNLGLECIDEYGVEINHTHVVQAGCFAQAIGVLELNWSEAGKPQISGGNQLLLAREFFCDAKCSEPLDKNTSLEVEKYLLAQENVCLVDEQESMRDYLDTHYAHQLHEFEQDVVAELSQELRHVRIPDEKGASQVSPLVARAMYQQAWSQGYEVDFGLHNAGGARISLPPGPLTAGDIAGRLLPFAIEVSYFEVSGTHLFAAIEGALDNAHDPQGTGTGSYPYAYQLRFEYDISRPQGERLVKLELYRDSTWISVEAEQVYRGVATAYTAAGKEGYQALLAAQKRCDLGVTADEAFIQYCRKVKKLD